MKKSEQNWVVVIITEGSIRLIGTPSGGALTRNGAWILEREMQLASPDLNIRSVQLERSSHEPS